MTATAQFGTLPTTVNISAVPCMSPPMAAIMADLVHDLAVAQANADAMAVDLAAAHALFTTLNTDVAALHLAVSAFCTAASGHVHGGVQTGNSRTGAVSHVTLGPALRATVPASSVAAKLKVGL